MDSFSLHAGRPFGGCAILYRKSLSLAISRLPTSSNRFSGIRINTCDGQSFLMFSVYMPYDNHPSSFTDYLSTLGELHGLIDAHFHTGIFLVGDFNVDFDRSGPLEKLSDFMLELDMLSVDVGHRSSIMYTYERDDGLSRSWIDHIVCSQSCSSLVSDISANHSGSNLSDHSPLLFVISATCEPYTPPCSPSCSSVSPAKINWSKVTSADADRFCDMVSKHLPSFQQEVATCSIHDCSAHHKALDSYTHSLVSTLESCSLLCFPSCASSCASLPKLPGWKGGTGKLREMSVFWHRVWVEAGCPSAGVLFNIKRNVKKRFKYAVRRLKHRKEFLIREKFACAFAARNKDKF